MVSKKLSKPVHFLVFDKSEAKELQKFMDNRVLGTDGDTAEYLYNECGVTKRIYVQTAGSAHRAHKTGMEIIRSIDKQKKGGNLENKGRGKEGRNKISASFQGQLFLASAGNIPVHDDPCTKKCSVYYHKGNKVG